MWNRNISKHLVTGISGLLAALLLSACTSGPDIHANYDQSVDFSSYQTFAFVDEPGTDRAGYASLVTEHFKTASRREMEAMGYTYSEDNPDLLVNFFTNIRNQQDVRSTPNANVGMSYGYYGYRYGMYSAWPMYGYGYDDVTTVNYQVGTANIDVIDTARNQMIWEGVVEGRLADDAASRSQEIINSVVTEVFKKYPLSPDFTDDM